MHLTRVLFSFVSIAFLNGRELIEPLWHGWPLQLTLANSVHCKVMIVMGASRSLADKTRFRTFWDGGTPVAPGAGLCAAYSYGSERVWVGIVADRWLADLNRFGSRG